MNQIIPAILAAFIIDYLFSDPESRRHPVALLGSFISSIEALLIKKGQSPLAKRFFGIILLVVTVTFVTLIGLAVRRIFMFIPGGIFIFGVVSIWITISPQKLGKMASGVGRSLAGQRLPDARRRLSRFVGRDTAGLSDSEIARAAIESVAENSVDALVAPIFFALIGGPIAALVYRAVNTLDSMVGYRNDRYTYFGWSSARVDDIFNFIPARLTRLIMAISATAVTGRWRQTITFGFKDGGRHSSPNSGIPEASMAGALNIRLGGPVFYNGESRDHGYIGADRQPTSADVTNAVKILRSMTVSIAISLLIIYAALGLI